MRAGSDSIAAISTGGKLWCWGYGWSGMLADGIKHDDDPHPSRRVAATNAAFADEVHA
jgi:alpha-tubulin suppressor-like RCC1 family protein